MFIVLLVVNWFFVVGFEFVFIVWECLLDREDGLYVYFIYNNGEDV